MAPRVSPSIIWGKLEERMPGWNWLLSFTVIVCAVMVYVCLGQAHVFGVAQDIDMVIVCALWAMLFFFWGTGLLVTLGWRIIKRHCLTK